METKKVGILGGGQLSRMLCQAAQRLGIHPVVFASQPDCSAANTGAEIHIGNETSLDDLRGFLSKVDVVIFENEFINCDQLIAASSEIQTEFFPAIETLHLLQNKLTQKHLFSKINLPTAGFIPFKEKVSLQEWLREVFQKFEPTGCVLKWGFQGYDGKGVFLIPQTKNVSAESPAIQEFCNNGLKNGPYLYAESLVPYKKELAIQAARSTNGEIVFYPLVTWNQREKMCFEVQGPASAFKVSTEIEQQAQSIIKTLFETINFIGVAAIEFFLTDQGLLINEVAPRVHNSGHWTLDYCATSQFENHIRACLGATLGSTESSPYFGMINLITPLDIKDIQKIPAPEVRSIPANTHLHWYEKLEARPLRKVGHLNFGGKNQEDFDRSQGVCIAWEEQWRNSLR